LYLKVSGEKDENRVRHVPSWVLLAVVVTMIALAWWL
jgi:hypothetical protein